MPARKPVGHAIQQGERHADALRSLMLSIIANTEMAQVDYVSVAHPQTLAELDVIGHSVSLSLAVFVGGVRLIDNMVVAGISDGNSNSHFL